MQPPSIHERSPAEVAAGGSVGDELSTTTGTLSGAKYPSPLTPTPFERYMLVEDRPAYSMSFVIVAELDGRADETAMRQAIRCALQRHPMLTARLVRRRGRTNWVGSTTEPTIVWHDSATGSAPATRPNPSRGSGVLFHVLRDDEQTSLHFYFHHAVTDGIGAGQFIGDVLALYGQQTATIEDRPRLLPLDMEHLKQRHRFDIRIPYPVSRFVARRSMLTESWKVIRRRPCVLRAPKDPPISALGDKSADPKLILDRDALGNYADVAAANDVTVNDLLLRDVFLTMRRWNASLGASSGREWLRATVPTNLRCRKALRMPAANMIGYAFLTHQAAECDDPPVLLSSLTHEMKAVTRWGLGAFFVRAIDCADRIPGLLWACSRMSRRFSTLVFSNGGEIVRRSRARFPTENGRVVAGNLVLRNVYGAPPVRPGTRLAIGVIEYDQQMTFVARYDRKHFTGASAVDFLNMFGEQLFHTTAARNNAPPRVD